MTAIHVDADRRTLPSRYRPVPAVIAPLAEPREALRLALGVVQREPEAATRQGEREQAAVLVLLLLRLNRYERDWLEYALGGAKPTRDRQPLIRAGQLGFGDDEVAAVREVEGELVLAAGCCCQADQQ